MPKTALFASLILLGMVGFAARAAADQGPPGAAPATNDEVMRTLAADLARTESHRLRRSAVVRAVIGPVLLGSGLVLIYQGTSGRGDSGESRDQFEPLVRDAYLLTGIGLAAGGVATLVSSVLHFRAANRRSAAIQIMPTRDGVGAAISGSF